MGATFTQTDTKGLVMLEGEVTLPYAEEVRRTLIKALIDSDDIVISLEGVQDVDLSCLQLLCSAHRSAMRLNKKVRVEGGQPPVYQELMRAAGYVRSSGCKLDCDKSCLWVGKGVHHVG